MVSFTLTEWLARFGTRRPWLVLALWAVFFLIGGAFASHIGNVLTNEQDFTTEPESAKATRLLEERLRGPRAATEMVIVRSETRTVDDPQFRAFVTALLAKVRDLPDTVGSATSFYEANLPSLVSPDRHTTLLPVTLLGTYEDAPDTVKPLTDLIREENGRDGFQVLTAGDGSIGHTFNEIAERDLRQAELLGLPIALFVLVLVFSTLVAAGVPILLALLAITMAIGAAALVGQVFNLSFFVINMITMIGLAVGIDYALFIIQRFREERGHGHPVEVAVARAGATANRAVLFSGGTVVIALCGLLIVPTTIFRSLALGAILVVIFAVLAALTLLPAVLQLLGDRVNSLRVPFLGRGRSAEGEGGFWGTAARLVMTRPWVSAIMAAALLLAAAVPYLTIKLGSSGVSSLPHDSDVYRAFAILQNEFSIGLLAPMEIVIGAQDVTAPHVQSAVETLVRRLAADGSFGPARLQTNQSGDLALLSVPVNAEAASDEALNALARLRKQYIPEAFGGLDAQVLVGGIAAQNSDFFDLVETYTPLVFAFVLTLSFILLLIAFRSLVVPVKAIIMNLLSVGAAYGLLVLVFQHGIGNELVGFQSAPKIEAWIPLFMFSILFGLSMDYHVFLLSRIRERFDQTGDNSGSVAFGLRSTAGVITGAAAIMVAVFAAFAAGELVMFQQVGFGLAVAILLDATIVRTVLVPASMQLLGNRNWYLPRWLQWLPDLRVEGTTPYPAHTRSTPLPTASGGYLASIGTSPSPNGGGQTAAPVPSAAFLIRPSSAAIAVAVGVLTLYDRRAATGTELTGEIIGQVMLTFKVQPEGKRFLSQCVDLGLAASGATIQEAFDAIEEATVRYLDSLTTDAERERVFAARGIVVEPLAAPDSSEGERV